MNETIKEIIQRLSVKYKIPETEILELLKLNIDKGYSLKKSEVLVRMSIVETLGINDFFTVEDMMLVLGKSRDDVIEYGFKLRQDAIAHGEDPDTFVIMMNKKELN